MWPGPSPDVRCPASGTVRLARIAQGSDASDEPDRDKGVRMTWRQWGWTLVVLGVLGFLLLITVPFVYEWRRGGLEWD